MTKILKWAGSKQKILKNLKRHFPEKINNYYEPFLGSGVVFFYLIKEEKIKGRAFLSDSCKELINFFSILKEDNESIYKNFTQIVKKSWNNKDFYEKQKIRFNQLIEKNKTKRLSTKETKEQAFLFFYLNKTCYNGIYRLSKKSNFNVPMGHYPKKPNIDSLEEDLQFYSNALTGVTILNLSYQEFFLKFKSKIKKDDFIYIDPPYYSYNKKISYTGYSADGFSVENHKELSQLIRANKNKCRILMNNYDNKEIRKLFPYNSFTYSKVFKSKQIIGGKNSKRGVGINEVSISNYNVKN